MRVDGPAGNLAGEPDPTAAAADCEGCRFVARRHDLNNARFGRAVDRLPVLHKNSPRNLAMPTSRLPALRSISGDAGASDGRRFDLTPRRSPAQDSPTM